MARSRKKTPVTGYGGDSDKKSKVKSNRVFRRITKEVLAKTDTDNIEEITEEIPLHKSEVSNVWDYPKDGKVYVSDEKYQEKVLRK